MSYQGRKFNWFTGVVEDRNDPLFLNRVRVRIYGNHTHDKQLIATPDLPWSEVLMPTTSPSLSGLGMTTHGLVEGSTVMGFYRDGNEEQDTVIIGSFIGIPQSFYRIDETIDDGGTRNFQEIERTTTQGFNDPRLDSEASYEGTPDGKTPQHINRNYGLTLALDKSPRRSGETTGELYPKTSYVNKSDVNLLARGDITTYPVITLVDGEGAAEDPTTMVHARYNGPERAETGETLGRLNYHGERDNTPDYFGTVTGYVNPTYPFNHVHETESGHIIELDDTPDYERIHLYHGTGTRIEIQKDGDYIEKVVRDKYSVVLGNDFVTITGDVVVNVAGNSYVNTTGNTTLTTGLNTTVTTTGNTTVTTTGNTLVDTTGTTTVNSTGNTDVTTPETLITSNVKIDGTLNVTGAQTNDSTITASDEVTGKGVELSTHTHTISSGSSAGKTKKPD